MTTTSEDRIRAQFRSHKKTLDYDVEGSPSLIMRLARQWARPCAEIRRIVGWPTPTSGAYVEPETK